jgi:hypothetical protein
MPYQPSWQVQVGLAKETTWGTAVPSTVFFPAGKNSKLDSRFQNLLEEGWEGIAAKDKVYVQGTGWTEVNWPDMWFYPDTSVHFLMAVMGADTVTGSSPFTHTITALNTGNTPSYSCTKFDGLVATARQSAGVYIEQVTLKFVNPGKFAINAVGRGKLATNATKPTASYSALTPYIPWQAALTLNGSSNARLVDCQIDIKRPLAQVWGMSNTQDMTGQVVQDMEVNEYNLFLNNTQGAFSVIFTNGTNTLTLQMSKLAFEDPTPIDHGQPAARIMATGRAIANATDAGTGNAAIKVVAVNSQASAY